MMRVILVYNGDVSDLAIQAMAAKSAIDHGIKEGGIFGVQIGDRYYGIKRNKCSLRVYPQEQMS